MVDDRSMENATTAYSAKQDRSGGRPAGAARTGAALEWDADGFLLRLREAKKTGERNTIKHVLKEVAESNYALSRTYWRPCPKTVAVPYSACKKRVSGTGRDPKITFSKMTTADAAFYFSQMSTGTRDRRVPGVPCALNFANGSQIGGGYKNGAIAQEEDLCRRFPQLYSSLFNASREGLYPFGPATCHHPERPAKYSDVLFTRDLVLARLGEEAGFEILPAEAQKKVSLVTAAAPNLSHAGRDIFDRELLYNTVKAIFIAPRMIQEEINTLILGAWGCGVFGGDPAVISELFVNAIQRDQLGRLYEEIHFAIPSFNPEDNNSRVFLETLAKHRIPYTEIDPTRS